MDGISTVSDLLKSEGSPIKEMTVVRSIIRLELKDGNVIEFARVHSGGMDWQGVKLNGVLVYLG